MRRLVFALMMAVVTFFAACSIEDAAPDSQHQSTSTSSTTTTTTTTTASGAAAVSGSAAFVEVGGVAYDLDAECHAAGVGEIVITALTPGLVEPRVELYLQAFLGEPYLGISITAGGESTLYEPSLAVPFDVVRQGDVFRVDDTPLVTDLDLATGDATDAGTGTVVVECASYAEGLPPGFGSG